MYGLSEGLDQPRKPVTELPSLGYAIVLKRGKAQKYSPYVLASTRNCKNKKQVASWQHEAAFSMCVQCGTGSRGSF
jgi:hypothetical protein